MLLPDSLLDRDRLLLDLDLRDLEVDLSLRDREECRRRDFTFLSRDPLRLLEVDRRLLDVDLRLLGECFLLFFDFFSREGDRRRFLGGDGLSLEEDEERRRTFDGLITYFGEESILGGETSSGTETRSLGAVSESFTLGL